jgi:hypothetical protein
MSMELLMAGRLLKVNPTNDGQKLRIRYTDTGGRVKRWCIYSPSKSQDIRRNHEDALSAIQRERKCRVKLAGGGGDVKIIAIAVKRELSKLEKAAGDEWIGVWVPVVQEGRA